MSYDKIRLRTGGKIPKLLGGGDTDFDQMGTVEYWLAKGKTANEAQALAANFNEMKYGNAQDLKFQTPDLSYQPGIKSQVSFTSGDPDSSFGQFTTTIDNLTGKATTTNTKSPTAIDPATDTNQTDVGGESSKRKDFGLAALNAADYLAQTTTGLFGGQMGVAGYEGMRDSITSAIESGDTAGGVIGALGGAQTIANSIVDQQLLQDKNFSAGSQAADQLVHGASSALMKSGNPYAIAAGAAIEGVNFLSKAGGSTTEGFDVNINNSGYGTLNHQDAQSNRNFFSINSRKIKNQLKKRNDQVMMALSAAELSNDMAFQQEARMNNIQNTIQNNQIALAGGLETSTLGG